MRIKCPSCSTVTELQLPILLAVCGCGSLVKGKFDASAARERPTAAAATVDHYAVLRIVATASDIEIKSAYRKRVKETHPDIGGDAEEFKLVQAAYEVLGNPEARRRYDAGESIGQQQFVGIVVQDFVGISVTEAVKRASASQLVARVAIVEVANSSRLRGVVVGQIPYPGIETTAGVVGLLVAVPHSSTLWQRFKVAATELASGFWVGIKSSTGTSTQRAAELGPGSSMHNAGAVAGEVVGTLAVGAVEAAVGVIGCFGKIVLAVAYTFLILMSFVLLAFAPPAGLLMAAFTVWLMYSAAKKSKKKT